MRFRWAVFAVVLATLPSCSLSRSALGSNPHDAGIDGFAMDAPGHDSGRDSGSDANIDANLPDMALPDMGLPDMAVPDMGTDSAVTPDMGVDAFVPPIDGGSDGGPCALCSGTLSSMCCGTSCVNVTTDVLHCGSCAPCASVTNAMTSVCTTGNCAVSVCAARFADCNHTYSDGCEIPLGTTSNCMICGDACMSLDHTTPACGATGCTYPCNSGYRSCEATSLDCETHTDADVNNCGACGHVCRTGQMCTAGVCTGWGTLATTGAPTGRSQHTAVWTGTTMIIWGGTTGMGLTPELNTGAIYNPTTNTWTAMSTNGAPSGRRGHAAVWTGTRMLVWGGYANNTGWVNTGGIYDPSTNTWAPLLSSTIVPAARSRFPFTWTGSELLIFGGWAGSGELSDGSHNNLTRWAATPTTGTPTARRYMPSVWSGTSLFIWGGDVGGLDGMPTSVLQTGARYDPSTDLWTAIGTSGRPAARTRHSAVWTGTQMVVWSGWNVGANVISDGGRYDLASDTWSTTAMASAPVVGRVNGTAVWTSSRMVVFGGNDDDGNALGDGASYDPAANTWTTLPTGGPSARADHTAVWTGTEMLVWGGVNSGGNLATGGAITP